MLEMEPLTLKGTDESPEIVMDKSANIFKIEGKSMPEDVREFYKPLLHWLDAYCQSPNNDTTLVFRMDYFNSASSKQILEVLYRLQNLFKKGYKVQVEWHYMIDDEDMEDAGLAFSGILEVPIKLVSYT